MLHLFFTPCSLWRQYADFPDLQFCEGQLFPPVFFSFCTLPSPILFCQALADFCFLFLTLKQEHNLILVCWVVPPWRLPPHLVSTSPAAQCGRSAGRVGVGLTVVVAQLPGHSVPVQEGTAKHCEQGSGTLLFSATLLMYSIAQCCEPKVSLTLRAQCAYRVNGSFPCKAEARQVGLYLAFFFHVSSLLAWPGAEVLCAIIIDSHVLRLVAGVSTASCAQDVHVGVCDADAEDQKFSQTRSVSSEWRACWMLARVGA